MQYGVDITENFFRAVGVLIFGVYKRPELGAEILNSLFALEWVGVFEESAFDFLSLQRLGRDKEAKQRSRP